MLMMGEGNRYNDSPDYLTSGDPSADFEFDGLSIDLDDINRILEENSGSLQSKPEDPPFRTQGGLAFESNQFQSGYSSETSGARSGSVDGLFDYHGKLEAHAHDCSMVQASSASFEDWFSIAQVTPYTERVGMSLPEMPSCSTASSFVEIDDNHVLDCGDNLNFDLVDNRNGTESKDTAAEFDKKNSLLGPAVENINLVFDQCGDILTNTLETPEAPENEVAIPMEYSSVGANKTSHNIISNESTFCHGSDIVSGVCDISSVLPNCMNGDDGCFTDSPMQYLYNSPSFMFKERKEGEAIEYPTESACSSSRMILHDQGRMDNRSVSQLSMTDLSDVKKHHFEVKGNGHILPAFKKLSYTTNDGHSDDKGSVQPFDRFAVCINNEHDKLVTPGNIFCQSAGWRKSINRVNSLDEYSKQFLSDVSPSMSNQLFVVNGRDVHHYHQDINLTVSSQTSLGGGYSEQYFPSSHPIISSMVHFGCSEDEKQSTLMPSRSIDLSKVSPESIHSNSSDCRSHVDGDPDICILEDISQPARSNQSMVLVKKTPSLPNSAFSNPHHYSGMGGIRFKGNDERQIFRVALQGLSQPKSEASPPDGVLTVPLLRHQRIALSWMTQKEKADSCCMGGILADDQGLGKTVSTIALILNERPPSSRASSQDIKKVEMETLNLDDDDGDGGDVVGDDEGMKQESDSSQVMSNGASKKRSFPSAQAKGRPAAGTLIVCPTSVLRQWAEELHNKVTSKAHLSVLVYHGSNRTKDPFELATYDVVLTTYSIVSMEVPKQPPVHGEDDEKGKWESDHASSSMDFPPSRKRKSPSSSNKKGVNYKKGVDELLLDSVSRPLAKVGWFRIVLDEAQSIKNHRTQVARACWGLRAKRRWCLSGTPIQNAIDDLYSYFRFLRYEPYAVYKSFCSSIKIPISKSPAKGYTKLQAILQTIMLRRTKGTLLDGKPIINLPPKVVELKKVEFTKEERDFYSRLESDSRAQFKEYAAAGTVKQNYVNILLMLLRLRQACDHPLLVRGFDSNSSRKLSIETAKKLPREKLTFLLSCLSSLSLCGICNDPSEDAVVAVCGHVFCNQCISEHLTGDDYQCPTRNCKARLSASSIFSNATLNSSLSEQPGQDSSLDFSSSKVEVFGPCSEDSLYGSSKIKAALDVLKKVAKPRDDGLKASFCPEGPSSLPSGDSPSGFPDETSLVTGESLNDSSKLCGEKAIVFSQWTRMLDLFEACLKSSSIQYRRLDGTMSVAARDKAVKDFNTLPEVSVMIMSLKAASLGLNMVAACHVLLLDLWWNPTTEDQAIDRAHRIGQTRPVTVLRLTVKDTVEDRILALQHKKREMVASAFGEDETGVRQTGLTVEDLEYLFMA
ncbi:helicase-like transcription factor CHR28 isoform X1 [Hibiscus syriacus]|uniref:helicase-like transcription factor CHR28 isoform X1 n=1 Tax=Hibiscus syriacus TaxID=106335 RepID=UPI001921B9FF|nr:helicase-like transcription factor CHR28 isoform X1 [Hibiscus syriacus]